LHRSDCHRGEFITELSTARESVDAPGDSELALLLCRAIVRNEVGVMRTHDAGARGRWSLFAGLWGWALLMHQATFDRWQYSPLGWALCALAIGLVLAPGSLPILAATVLVNTAYAFQCLPHTANHLVFEGLVCFGWSLALGAHAIRALLGGEGWRRALGFGAEQAHPLERSRAPLAAALLLVYWLSVLHKLNHDFVDPSTSCAAYMYRRVALALPFLPRAPWAEQVSIWSTLLAEAALPVLLLWRRTWQLGLVAALSFHLMLAFDPTPGIYSFTGLLFAFFVLVLPDTFVETALDRLHALVARVVRVPLLCARGAGALLLGSLLAYGATRHDRWAFQPTAVFFLFWASLVIAGYLVTLLTSPEAPGEPGAAIVPRRARPSTPAWLWVMPGLVLLNGLNPYLGLRTQLSFSMFSNLRTEGGISNHLFMPRLLSLGDYQEDLVEILTTDDPELADFSQQQLLLPYFEFRRLVGGLDDVSVTYLRGGERHTFECASGQCNDPELARPVSGLVARLLYFRPVDKGPRMLCRH
jgi:hypothetical protein